MGVASGSVLEALESEVLFLGPLLKDLSCLPLLEIQSSLVELLRRMSLFPAVGRLCGWTLRPQTTHLEAPLHYRDDRHLPRRGPADGPRRTTGHCVDGLFVLKLLTLRLLF